MMMMIKTLVKDKPYVAELAATVAVLKKKRSQHLVVCHCFM